jgi:hypothetical protein
MRRTQAARPQAEGERTACAAPDHQQAADPCVNGRHRGRAGCWPPSWWPAPPSARPRPRGRMRLYWPPAMVLFTPAASFARPPPTAYEHVNDSALINATLAAAGIERDDSDLLVLLKRYATGDVEPPCTLLSFSRLQNSGGFGRPFFRPTPEAPSHQDPCARRAPPMPPDARAGAPSAAR